MWSPGNFGPSEAVVPREGGRQGRKEVRDGSVGSVGGGGVIVRQQQQGTIVRQEVRKRCFTQGY